MTNEKIIQIKLKELSNSPFRAKFHLRKKEREIVETKGLPVIREHAAELITKRIAPAFPTKDGKQTPFKNHPVFIAQHATATCCRSCLEKWHHIPKGREITQEELEYIINLIETWISRDLNILTKM